MQTLVVGCAGYAKLGYLEVLTLDAFWRIAGFVEKIENHSTTCFVELIAG